MRDRELVEDISAIDHGAMVDDPSNGSNDFRGTREFEWEKLIATALHPVKVGIIEALWRQREALSPTQIGEIFSEEEIYMSIVSYHARNLAKLGVLEVVRKRQVRGAFEHFYYFRDGWRPSD